MVYVARVLPFRKAKSHLAIYLTKQQTVVYDRFLKNIICLKTSGYTRRLLAKLPRKTDAVNRSTPVPVYKYTAPPSEAELPSNVQELKSDSFSADP